MNVFFIYPKASENLQNTHTVKYHVLMVKQPLKTNKLIYWIKILLRYSYWISDALFLFFFLLVGGKTHCASIAARASDVSTWET
jgi:Na+/H+ antiporter NhaA